MAEKEYLELDRRTYMKLASGAVVAPSLVRSARADDRGHAPHKEKYTRLDAYLSENELEAVWFADSDSYAWLTGHSNVIDRSSSTGVAAAGYDGDSVRIVVDNDEKALVREELFRGPPGKSGHDHGKAKGRPPNIEIITFDWYANTLANAVAEQSPTPAAADFDVPGFDSVNATPLRQPLTKREIDRYRSIGRETATAVEAVCRAVRPEDTEQEMANAIGAVLDAYNLDHPVVLVAGEERAQKYRHPVPTDAKLGGYVVVSVVGRRGGLYASCTRTVAFDGAPGWLEQRHRDVMRVDATALAGTRAAIGTDETAGDVFAAIQSAYAETGYPEEWQLHHQGGAAGYASREWVATPTSTTDVTGPMAYAWNPTLQGTKSEGTVLVTEKGYEPFTLTGNWPTQTVESYSHADRVVRPDVLFRTDL